MRAGAQRPVFAEDAVQAPPVEVLHRDVEQPVGLGAEVDDLDRVRMVQAGRGLCLAVKARSERGVVRVLAVHHLERDGLLESDLPSPEDGAHGSAADVVLDHVLAGDRSPDEEVVVGLLHPFASVPGTRGSGDRSPHARTRRPARGRDTAPAPRRALLRRLDERLGDRIRAGGEERLVDRHADVIELQLEAVEVLVQPLAENLLDRGVLVFRGETPQ